MWAAGDVRTSTASFGITSHGITSHGMVCRGFVGHGTVGHGVVFHGIIWYGIIDEPACWQCRPLKISSFCIRYNFDMQAKCCIRLAQLDRKGANVSWDRAIAQPKAAAAEDEWMADASSCVQLVVVDSERSPLTRAQPETKELLSKVVELDEAELAHGPLGLEGLVAPGARDVAPPADELDVPAALEGPLDVAEEAVRELCLGGVARRQNHCSRLWRVEDALHHLEVEDLVDPLLAVLHGDLDGWAPGAVVVGLLVERSGGGHGHLGDVGAGLWLRAGDALQDVHVVAAHLGLLHVVGVLAGRLERADDGALGAGAVTLQEERKGLEEEGWSLDSVVVRDSSLRLHAVVVANNNIGQIDKDMDGLLGLGDLGVRSKGAVLGEALIKLGLKDVELSGLVDPVERVN